MTETAQARRTRLPAAQRRESILTAAVAVFAAAGYRAGKMSDVAARVGVSEPVIFQNFGSKAALFAAVLDRVSEDLRAELETPSGHIGSASGLLAHILSPGHTGLHVPGCHGVLFADAISLAADPDRTEPTARAARAIAGHLADLVRRGQTDGDFRSDLDADAAAWLLLSSMSTRALREAVAPEPHRIESALAALILRALSA